MEHENHYASKAVGGAGLGLGIAGTALGLMAGGLNGTGLFGNGTGGCGCGDNAAVSRYEAAQNAKIAELETEVKLRDANIYTDGKILDLYKYIDGKVGCIEAQICEQRVYNATNNAAVSCIQAQVAQLMSLTKIIVPNGSVCPGWGDVTVTPATSTTA